MKRFVILSLLALSLGAQTKVNLIDIKPPAAPVAPVYLFGMFPSVGLIAIDPAGFVLDKSTTPPTLRAVPGGGSSGTDFDDIFTAAAGQVAFVSTAAPKSLVRLFKNGLLMRLNLDYTLATDPGSKLATITVLPIQGITVGDDVTLSYQK